MKNKHFGKLINSVRVGIATLLLVFISAFIFSFSTHKMNDDFLKELGLTKTDADQKISNSIIGGYLDAYGARNAKNIALGKRAAVVKDLLLYTKDYVASPAFKKEYEAMRQSHKPVMQTAQTPEEMKKGLIEQYKKSVAETEATLKKADASVKAIFEKALTDAKAELKKVEDPNNEMLLSYKESYPEMAKQMEANNKFLLQDWEKKYPADPMPFVKQRLEEFLKETADIDFTATTELKNGKKVFTDSKYERKSNRWKMAYRAGKEVVEPARAFVQQWISEIK